MDRTPAAIHHDRGVEQLFGLVEADIVVAGRIDPEIAFDVMPVEAGATNRLGRVAIRLLMLPLL
jgi:hypothetical protein